MLVARHSASICFELSHPTQPHQSTTLQSQRSEEKLWPCAIFLFYHQVSRAFRWLVYLNWAGNHAAISGLFASTAPDRPWPVFFVKWAHTSKGVLKLNGPIILITVRKNCPPLSPEGDITNIAVLEVVDRRCERAELQLPHHIFAYSARLRSEFRPTWVVGRGNWKSLFNRIENEPMLMWARGYGTSTPHRSIPVVIDSLEIAVSSMKACTNHGMKTRRRGVGRERMRRSTEKTRRWCSFWGHLLHN